MCVGVTGFEPATSSSRTTRATKLRHTPVPLRASTRIADKPGPADHSGSQLDATSVISVASGGQANRTGA